MKKTRVCGMYREYKGSVSGMDSLDSQVERMNRMTELWNNKMKNKEFLITGDMNICWTKINDPEYHNKMIARKLMDYILEENITQMNEEYTREEAYNGVIKRSNLDHFYTNTPELIKNLTAEYLSSSDHKVIKCRKYYK